MIYKSIIPHQPSDVVFEFEAADSKEVDRAAVAAQTAHLEWAGLAATERSKALARGARARDSPG